MRVQGSLYLCPALLILLAGCQTLLAHNVAPEVIQQNGIMYAACRMQPHSPLPEGSPAVTGLVLFKQDHPDGKVNVIVHLDGFSDNDTQPRGLHIHQFGDLSDGCTSTGSHFNPYGVDHPNHVGDMGNISPHHGHAHAEIELQSAATLVGGLSLIGRTVLLHAGRDDLGLGGTAASLLHGNAGPRISCCVIGIASDTLWNKHKKDNGTE